MVIGADDQNRLLEYKRVSAAHLNEYGMQARALAMDARAAQLLPEDVLPGLDTTHTLSCVRCRGEAVGSYYAQACDGLPRYVSACSIAVLAID